MTQRVRVPGDAAIVAFVPHAEGLLDAAAVVTHAGHGTVAAAMRHAVPVAGLPEHAADQPALAARLAERDAGIALDGEPATPADIRAAVGKVLGQRLSGRSRHRRRGNRCHVRCGRSSQPARQLRAAAWGKAVRWATRVVGGTGGPPIAVSTTTRAPRRVAIPRRIRPTRRGAQGAMMPIPLLPFQSRSVTFWATTGNPPLRLDQCDSGSNACSALSTGCRAAGGPGCGYEQGDFVVDEWPSTVRRVSPPIPVWVGVRKLLVLGTEILVARNRAGLRTETDGPGLLFERARREDGGMLSWVTYQLVTADDQFSRPVSHYVPAHLLRRRGPARRHRFGDYRPRTHG